MAGVTSAGRRPWRRRARDADRDGDLVERLRQGDEEAFMKLVARHHDSMLRVARSYVRSDAVAEEVVQDTWLAALRGLGGFRGEASFRTWLLAILVRRARSTGVREHRSVAVEDVQSAVDPRRFDSGGAWSAPPTRWDEDAESRLDAAALGGVLRRCLAALPDRQRDVVMLRDVDGLTAAEVCASLAISEANQRVLLHRGRSTLRSSLEAELGAR